MSESLDAAEMVVEPETKIDHGKIRNLTPVSENLIAFFYTNIPPYYLTREVLALVHTIREGRDFIVPHILGAEGETIAITDMPEDMFELYDVKSRSLWSEDEWGYIQSLFQQDAQQRAQELFPQHFANQRAQQFIDQQQEDEEGYEVLDDFPAIELPPDPPRRSRGRVNNVEDAVPVVSRQFRG